MKKLAQENRVKIPLEGEWKYKRLTIEVNGNKIDAVIVGKPSTLNNGRWILAAHPIGEVYEERLSPNTDFMRLASELKSNAIIFNYPSRGTSTGWLTREGAEKAHQAMLKFLEDQHKGIGAKEVIDYSYDSGGWIQESSLKAHDFKRDVKYVVVRNSVWAQLDSLSVGKFVSAFVGFDCIYFSSSKTLQVPEIILHPAQVDAPEELKESSKLAVASKMKIPVFAKSLLDDEKCPKTNKIFIGVPQSYKGEIQDPKFLAEKIISLLKK